MSNFSKFRLSAFAVLLTFFSICLLFQSCSNDDDNGWKKLENQTNTVTVKIYSNTPDVPIRVSGIGSDGQLVVKNSWEDTYKTRSFLLNITARCDDDTALITGEIYINGKLVNKKQGNSYINIGARIKGKGYE